MTCQSKLAFGAAIHKHGAAHRAGSQPHAMQILQVNRPSHVGEPNCAALRNIADRHRAPIEAPRPVSQHATAESQCPRVDDDMAHFDMIYA
jgi:hypothetical protein